MITHTVPFESSEKEEGQYYTLDEALQAANDGSDPTATLAYILGCPKKK